MIELKVLYNSNHIYHISYPGHPESPDRVIRIADFLYNKEVFLDIEEYYPNLEEIFKVHKKSYVYDLMKYKNFKLDEDTVVRDKTFFSAMHSAGLAILAAKYAKKGYYSFSINRPPGHHAGYNFGGGFCYLNNITIAVFNVFKDKNVVILDLDVHHGNGTEDIVNRFSEGNIYYVSLHQKDIYPLTGYKHGKYSLNFPLPGGIRYKEYEKELKYALTFVESKLKDIDVLALSMGFDTYIEDPLANFYLEMEDYYKLGKLLREYVEDNNLKFFSVLEGGYSRDLPYLYYNFLKGFYDYKK